MSATLTKKKAPKKAAKASKPAKKVAKAKPAVPGNGKTGQQKDEWSVEELAAREKVHQKTVLLWCTQGKVKARHDVGNGVRGKWYINKKTYVRPAGMTKVAGPSAKPARSAKKKASKKKK